MSEHKGISCPEGSLVVAQVGDHEWTFEYPRLEWEIFEAFHNDIDDWRRGDEESTEKE